MTDGCRWRYTLKDPETGAVIAEGTSAELYREGYFEAVTEVSYLWQRQEKGLTTRKTKSRYRIERISCKAWRAEQAKARGLAPDEQMETRKIRVYSCYNAAGELMAQGTAQELQDRGIFGCANTCHAAYRRGGTFAPAGIVRMTMEVQPRQVRHLKKLPEEKSPSRKKIGGVVDPSPLAYDVHDLIHYNETALAAGKPELSYGWWAAKGKPATA